MKILNIGYDSTNYYLLANPRPILLVDIGWPGTLAKMARSLKRYDLQFRDIPYALATHYHPDHAGLAQELKPHGTKLIVLENQLETAAHFSQYRKPENQLVAIQMGDNLNLKLSESRAFLARIGIAGELIATPGHSDDSITLVLDEGLAFTGDLHPADFVPDANEAQKARASWEKIRQLGAHTVYPGHGPLRRI